MSETSEADTIWAHASGHGARAALAVLRISGPRAIAALETLLAGRPLPRPREAALRTLFDPRDGATLDSALVLVFDAPRSFTGEAVVEIHHHGGIAMRNAFADALGSIEGLSLAEPGAFTKRAFLNGKLDLTAAEAIADLIEASTRAQARQALAQFQGRFAMRLDAWRASLLAARAQIEAELDFAAEEGDVGDDRLETVRDDLVRTAREIKMALCDNRAGERLRESLTVAVVGAPNAGKSSLVNAIAGREVAIVTPIAGTTRDVLEVQLDLGGWPVTLLDTAGLREAEAEIEALGIARARERAASADLLLVLVDASDPVIPPDLGLAERLTVLNKIDIAPPSSSCGADLAISCSTGAGIDDLLARLEARASDLCRQAGDAVITRARHRTALEEARKAIGRVLDERAPRELVLLAEDLRIAADAIGLVTGRIGVEEILDQIFARFCIGK